ncbi:E3 ubiquitin-protein ligase CHFR isoform X2 [Ascaphus truei]|uniref:E3 ubiquitin-protein ligase CHFR isoform X2 n=1 Tax=Ascaphus truei TaxID=8439 RepID=UPI003F5A86FF
MEGSGERQPWGKLSRLPAADADSTSEVLLCKKEWTIGRKKACDLSFPGNKLVSGEHCKITVDEESGHVSLEDTSTNGTVINKMKVVKKQSCRLQNGDVIYVVYRKNEPEQNVAYLYKSLNPAQDHTQEPAVAVAEALCQLFADTSGAERLDETQAVASLQVTPLSYEEPRPSTSTSNLFSTPTTSATESAALHPQPSAAGLSCAEVPAQADSGQPRAGPGTHSMASGHTDGTSLPEPAPAGADEGDSHPPRKRLRADESWSGAHTPADPDSSKGAQDEAKAACVKPDKMEETLSCIICQELLHDCVSLQPCMHTFCAACYSGWMERSSLCPTCRCPVERICKNHILNNLVEAFLIQHPDKCRSEEDRRSMDARNKITQDMLQPKVRRTFSDEEGSSEDLLDLSDVDSESSDISQAYTVCRQCPGYAKHSIQPIPYPPPPETEASLAPGDAPSTSANFPAAVQEYACPSQGTHVICTCCFQPMPDRRAEREQNPHVVPQQCTVCLQPFCHMYWGCTRIGCFGCLSPFCEINLGEKCLDAVLNNNNYESDILKNYLASRGLTWKDLLNESLAAVQRGVFLLSVSADCRINGTTVLCYFCGLRNFRDLTYQYRQNIPASELPMAVTSRPNCYWGRNCRTQVKAHHAMKFNHICEQTRFKN